MFNCLVGCGALAQQLHELAADDRPAGITGCGLKGGLVADTEADQPGIVQVQAVDPLEVGHAALEVLLRPRDGGARHHIDEAARVGVDLADTGLGCLGRDEHDDLQVEAVGDGLVTLHVIGEG